MNTAYSKASARTGALVRALLLAASVLGSLTPVHAQVCTVVQLQLGQQAALEREAFDAHLTLNNTLGDALQNLFVNVSITDANGNPADAQFFLKVNSLSGTNAVDGTGVVQSSGTADIHWLIIPSTGAGGSSTLGLGYNVTANISYLAAGVTQTVQTLPASITVVPQPALKLEYVLPYEVFAQEPLLPQTITAPQPFPLGVRVTNVGFGPAHNFQIESAHPQIVDNKQGLLVNYQLLGTVVGGVNIPNTLLIPFGDVAAGGVSQAEWTMQSSLSGRFIQFTSTFTHAAELGGQLTSLIQSVTTYTLLKDVFVDLPGRDSLSDFLINESQSRVSMQTLLDSGSTPPAEFILESDHPAPLPVTEVSAALNGTLGSSNSTLNVMFLNSVSSGTWVHAVVPFTSGDVATLVSAQRSDGKVIDPHNVWVSKHFRKSDLSYLYWINIIDYASTANSYALQFNPGSLAQPPGAVRDLATTSAAGVGQVQLDWTAPGDNGYSGTILGGRYLLAIGTNSAGSFAPGDAQINFATTTSAGNREGYLATNLLGNATLYAYLWTQNPAGMYSPISNGATLYTLPYPPNGLAAQSISSASLTVSWQAGNNLPPISYAISLSTAMGGNPTSSPLQSSSFTYVFAGLTPNTSYFASGIAENPSSGALSPASGMGVLVTAAASPSLGAFTGASTATLTSSWSLAGNPSDTEFWSELSTSSSGSPVVAASGWIRATSYMFSGLSANTVYYGRVKARNRAAAETAYADLGSAQTGVFAVIPPSGAAGSGFALTGANFGPFAGTNTRVRFGVGGELAAISAWTGARITGTVPADLSSGTYAVLVERQNGASVTTLNGGSFAVIAGAPSTGAVVTLVPADGDQITTNVPSLEADYASAASIDTTTVRLTLDGAAIAAVVFPSSSVYVPSAALSDGTHTVTASVVDLTGALAASTATFLVDTVAPITTLSVNGLTASTTALAVISTDTLSLGATDGGSGVADTVYLLDVDPNSCDFSTYVSTAAPGTCANPYYAGAFALAAGLHTVAFYSDDEAGNSEDYRHVAITVAAPRQIGALPPVTTIEYSTPSFVSSGTVVAMATRSSVTLTAVALSSGAAVAATYYGVDASTPTTPYLAPFSVAVGTHTIYYRSVDTTGNAEPISSATVAVYAGPFAGTVVPSTGSIGVSLSLVGFNFGAYGGAKSQLFFGVSTAPISVWNDGQITASVPGVSSRTYALTVQALLNGATTTASVGFFSVLAPQIMTVVPSSGPIGLQFTLSGQAFGAYNGANTQVLLGGATVPISVWNDTTITGVVPGVLSPGSYPVQVERKTSDGGLALSNAVNFDVLGLTLSSVSPSTGPIGIAFGLTGAGFGTYNGNNTQVLIGGTTAAISVWTDTGIQGTIPALPAGAYPLSVERVQGSGVAFSNVATFTVTALTLAAPVPSSGPIGVAFTVSGTEFGAYNGANTRLLMGGSTVAVSVWNDTTITGTVPTLSTGAQATWIERLTGGGLESSNTVYFQVVAPTIASVFPSSGPIGTSFSLSGSGFGTYNGANTQVLVGGTTAPVSVWNDGLITATVPGTLSTGTAAVVAERIGADGGVVLSAPAAFLLVAPAAGGITPSTGPIGIAFTLSGSGFGVYNGANTQLLIGGATTAISVWNDATIQGTVPALSTGAYPVVVERVQGQGTSLTTVATFTVTALAIPSPTPSVGPVGTSFTLSGSGFGAFNGAATRLLIGGSTVAVSVWTDSTITGVVPTLAVGAQPVWIERSSGAGLQASNTVYFQVIAPAIASVFPSSGPIGVSFTLSGSGFGTYNGANTQVLLGGTTVPISVWNDTTITGTVPGALTPGSVPVVVERIGTGGISFSSAAAFLVLAPSVASVAPSSAPIGSAFTLTGSAFGPYNGANTQVLIGGATTSISVWTDGRIQGTVPALSSGTYDLVVERLQGGYASLSSSSAFTVTAPQVAAMTPSSAPIGAPFTITGVSFGAYNGSNTRVKFNGMVASVSVWNDTTISGTVPGAVSSGPATVVVERAVGSGVAAGVAPAFLVLMPTISTITPSYGPAGTAVTLYGFGFGPYAASSGTQLLVNGSTMAVAVWTDGLIRWTVPTSLPDGSYPVVVSRTPAGGSVQSSSATFTVGTGMGTGAFGVRTAVALSARPDWYFQGDLNLPAAEGGAILTPSQAAVTVPPGALAADTEVTISREKALLSAARAAALSQSGLEPAGEAISFGPEGTQFSSPVTIELPYDPALVAPGMLGRVAVHYFDPNAKTWTALPTQLDPSRHVLIAQTSHFSLYQPLGLGIRPATADASFGFKAVYVFPNPARGVNAVTIRVQPGQADSVEVQIYDLAGRKVHDSTGFTVNPGFDDGNGLGAQITYDHVWDISGVGSGVYTYVVTAKKAGQADIHKTGKVGVVK